MYDLLFPLLRPVHHGVDFDIGWSAPLLDRVGTPSLRMEHPETKRVFEKCFFLFHSTLHDYLDNVPPACPHSYMRQGCSTFFDRAITRRTTHITLNSLLYWEQMIDLIYGMFFDKILSRQDYLSIRSAVNRSPAHGNLAMNRHTRHSLPSYSFQNTPNSPKNLQP